jgi:hypothetical protein
MGLGKRYRIVLDRVECNGTSESGSYNDEVYITFQADAGHQFRYPLVETINMNTQNSDNAVHVWNANLVLDFDHEVLVTLWDNDPGREIRSDFLINCEYRGPNPPPSYTMINYNGANYTLYASPDPAAKEG